MGVKGLAYVLKSRREAHSSPDVQLQKVDLTNHAIQFAVKHIEKCMKERKKRLDRREVLYSPPNPKGLDLSSMYVNPELDCIGDDVAVADFIRSLPRLPIVIDGDNLTYLANRNVSYLHLGSDMLEVVANIEKLVTTLTQVCYLVRIRHGTISGTALPAGAQILSPTELTTAELASVEANAYPLHYTTDDVAYVRVPVYHVYVCWDGPSDTLKGATRSQRFVDFLHSVTWARAYHERAFHNDKLICRLRAADVTTASQVRGPDTSALPANEASALTRMSHMLAQGDWRGALSLASETCGGVLQAARDDQTAGMYPSALLSGLTVMSLHNMFASRGLENIYASTDNDVCVLATARRLRAFAIVSNDSDMFMGGGLDSLPDLLVISVDEDLTRGIQTRAPQPLDIAVPSGAAQAQAPPHVKHETVHGCFLPSRADLCAARAHSCAPAVAVGTKAEASAAGPWLPFDAQPGYITEMPLRAVAEYVTQAQGSTAQASTRGVSSASATVASVFSRTERAALQLNAKRCAMELPQSFLDPLRATAQICCHTVTFVTPVAEEDDATLPQPVDVTSQPTLHTANATAAPANTLAYLPTALGRLHQLRGCEACQALLTAQMTYVPTCARDDDGLWLSDQPSVSAVKLSTSSSASSAASTSPAMLIPVSAVRMPEWQEFLRTGVVPDIPTPASISTDSQGLGVGAAAAEYEYALPAEAVALLSEPVRASVHDCVLMGVVFAHQMTPSCLQLAQDHPATVSAVDTLSTSPFPLARYHTPAHAHLTVTAVRLRDVALLLNLSPCELPLMAMCASNDFVKMPHLLEQADPGYLLKPLRMKSMRVEPDNTIWDQATVKRLFNAFIKKCGVRYFALLEPNRYLMHLPHPNMFSLMETALRTLRTFTPRGHAASRDKFADRSQGCARGGHARGRGRGRGRGAHRGGHAERGEYGQRDVQGYNADYNHGHRNDVSLNANMSTYGASVYPQSSMESYRPYADNAESELQDVAPTPPAAASGLNNPYLDLLGPRPLPPPPQPPVYNHMNAARGRGGAGRGRGAAGHGRGGAGRGRGAAGRGRGRGGPAYGYGDRRGESQYQYDDQHNQYDSSSAYNTQPDAYYQLGYGYGYGYGYEYEYTPVAPPVVESHEYTLHQYPQQRGLTHGGYTNYRDDGQHSSPHAADVDALTQELASMHLCQGEEVSPYPDAYSYAQGSGCGDCGGRGRGSRDGFTAFAGYEADARGGRYAVTPTQTLHTPMTPADDNVGADGSPYRYAPPPASELFVRMPADTTPMPRASYPRSSPRAEAHPIRTHYTHPPHAAAPHAHVSIAHKDPVQPDVSEHASPSHPDAPTVLQRARALVRALLSPAERAAAVSVLRTARKIQSTARVQMLALTSDSQAATDPAAVSRARVDVLPVSLRRALQCHLADPRVRMHASSQEELAPLVSGAIEPTPVTPRTVRLRAGTYANANADVDADVPEARAEDADTSADVLALAVCRAPAIVSAALELQRLAFYPSYMGSTASEPTVLQLPTSICGSTPSLDLPVVCADTAAAEAFLMRVCGSAHHAVHTLQPQLVGAEGSRRLSLAPVRVPLALTQLLTLQLAARTRAHTSTHERYTAYPPAVQALLRLKHAALLACADGTAFWPAGDAAARPRCARGEPMCVDAADAALPRGEDDGVAQATPSGLLELADNMFDLVPATTGTSPERSGAHVEPLAITLASAAAPRALLCDPLPRALHISSLDAVAVHPYLSRELNTPVPWACEPQRGWRAALALSPHHAAQFLLQTPPVSRSGAPAAPAAAHLPSYLNTVATLKKPFAAAEVNNLTPNPLFSAAFPRLSHAGIAGACSMPLSLQDTLTSEWGVLGAAMLPTLPDASNAQDVATAVTFSPSSLPTMLLCSQSLAQQCGLSMSWETPLAPVDEYSIWRDGLRTRYQSECAFNRTMTTHINDVLGGERMPAALAPGLYTDAPVDVDMPAFFTPLPSQALATTTCRGHVPDRDATVLRKDHFVTVAGCELAHPDDRAEIIYRDGLLVYTRTFSDVPYMIYGKMLHTAPVLLTARKTEELLALALQPACAAPTPEHTAALLRQCDAAITECVRDAKVLCPAPAPLVPFGMSLQRVLLDAIAVEVPALRAAITDESAVESVQAFEGAIRRNRTLSLFGVAHLLCHETRHARTCAAAEPSAAATAHAQEVEVRYRRAEALLFLAQRLVLAHIDQAAQTALHAVHDAFTAHATLLLETLEAAKVPVEDVCARLDALTQAQAQALSNSRMLSCGSLMGAQLAQVQTPDSLLSAPESTPRTATQSAQPSALPAHGGVWPLFIAPMCALRDMCIGGDMLGWSDVKQADWLYRDHTRRALVVCAEGTPDANLDAKARLARAQASSEALARYHAFHKQAHVTSHTFYSPPSPLCPSLPCGAPLYATLSPRDMVTAQLEVLLLNALLRGTLAMAGEGVHVGADTPCGCGGHVRRGNVRYDFAIGQLYAADHTVSLPVLQLLVAVEVARRRHAGAHYVGCERYVNATHASTAATTDVAAQFSHMGTQTGTSPPHLIPPQLYLSHTAALQTTFAILYRHAHVLNTNLGAPLTGISPALACSGPATAALAHAWVGQGMAFSEEHDDDGNDSSESSADGCMPEGSAAAAAPRRWVAYRDPDGAGCSCCIESSSHAEEAAQPRTCFDWPCLCQRTSLSLSEVLLHVWRVFYQLRPLLRAHGRITAAREAAEAIAAGYRALKAALSQAEQPLPSPTAQDTDTTLIAAERLPALLATALSARNAALRCLKQHFAAVPRNAPALTPLSLVATLLARARFPSLTAAALFAHQDLCRASYSDQSSLLTGVDGVQVAPPPSQVARLGAPWQHLLVPCTPPLASPLSRDPRDEPISLATCVHGLLAHPNISPTLPTTVPVGRTDGASCVIGAYTHENAVIWQHLAGEVHARAIVHSSINGNLWVPKTSVLSSDSSTSPSMFAPEVDIVKEDDEEVERVFGVQRASNTCPCGTDVIHIDAKYADLVLE